MVFRYDMCVNWCMDFRSLNVLSSQAGKTLSARRWHAAFSEDGHLDIAKVLRRIQRGVGFFCLNYVVLLGKLKSQSGQSNSLEHTNAINRESLAYSKA